MKNILRRKKPYVKLYIQKKLNGYYINKKYEIIECRSKIKFGKKYVFLPNDHIYYLEAKNKLEATEKVDSIIKEIWQSVKHKRKESI